jgi:hypothetical protein|tara:strand:+ start:1685 stop:1933 length:249 start_codon:yes stop_codon:yes gene_type:complete
MPQGVSGAYKSGYIMGQMSKQGAMSEANESSLYREGLEKEIAGTNAGSIEGPFESTMMSSSGKGSGHTAQLGMIMGSSKYTG